MTSQVWQSGSSFPALRCRAFPESGAHVTVGSPLHRHVSCSGRRVVHAFPGLYFTMQGQGKGLFVEYDSHLRSRLGFLESSAVSPQHTVRCAVRTNVDRGRTTSEDQRKKQVAVRSNGSNNSQARIEGPPCAARWRDRRWHANENSVSASVEALLGNTVSADGEPTSRSTSQQGEGHAFEDSI